MFKEHITQSGINIRTVYDILDQICKYTDLYPHVKQHTSKRDGKGVHYAIYFRLLGPNHANMKLKHKYIKT